MLKPIIKKETLKPWESDPAPLVFLPVQENQYLKSCNFCKSEYVTIPQDQIGLCEKCLGDIRAGKELIYICQNNIFGNRKK